MRTIATALLTLLVALQMVAGEVMEWHFSNEPYKKVLKAGKAQLKIHISPVPEFIHQQISRFYIIIGAKHP